MLRLPRENIRALFTDLDDTLTDDSMIAPDTYAALCAVRENGLWTVIVSGRPAGWADSLMRLWPLDAMIFENGAGLMVREGKNIRTVSLADMSDREAQRKKREEVYRRLVAAVPGIKTATDQPFRLFDTAVDYAEEPPFLDREAVDKLMALLAAEHGITAKLSSIHINYWCGAHTKVTACRRLLDTEGKTRGIRRENVLFCGDSPNDEPLFEFFDHTVGVANIARFLGQLKTPPKQVTSKPGGMGFREIVRALLSP